MYHEFTPALPNNAGIMMRQHERSVFDENDHPLQDHMLAFGMIDHNPGGLKIVKPDPGMEECYWAGFDAGGYGDDQLIGYGFMNQNMSLHGNLSSVSMSPKKRKADKGETLKVVPEKEKKMKRCLEGDSKIATQNNNNNNSSNTDNSSKQKSKFSEVQKPDYIHVRARRGQATDSHSLAERVRREKISERMKYLQDLVPGCNKITGKAGMLDEIINYVQSLQKQVEFLSLKLATVNPELDFNIVNGLTKEMFQAHTTEFSAFACSSTNSAYFEQLSSLDQAVSYCGLDMGFNSEEMGMRSIISVPVSIPNHTFMDSSCFNVISSDISTLSFDL